MRNDFEGQFKKQGWTIQLANYEPFSKVLQDGDWIKIASKYDYLIKLTMSHDIVEQ